MWLFPDDFLSTAHLWALAYGLPGSTDLFPHCYFNVSRHKIKAVQICQIIYSILIVLSCFSSTFSGLVAFVHLFSLCMFVVTFELTQQHTPIQRIAL